MALLKKAAMAEPFRVPSLADVDETYGALVTRRSELNVKLSEAMQARRAAEKELAADTSREVRPGVAALLGDGESAKALKRRAAAEAKQAVSDIETALVEVERRLRDAKTAAVRSMIARVRPEWDKRTRELAETLKAAQAAHLRFEDLRLELEAEDVSSDYFGPRPFFLGDAKDGRIANYLREAGYGA
jgi:hypothetical protein